MNDALPFPNNRRESRPLPARSSMTFFAELPQWVKITAFLGFPCVACSAMAGACVAGLLWVGNELVIPIRDSVIKTHDKLTVAVEGIQTEIHELRELVASQKGQDSSR